MDARDDLLSVTSTRTLALRSALAFVAVVVVALAGACGGGGDADPQASLGREVWDARCAVCHGVDGEGGVAPATGNGATVLSLPDVADHVDVVTNGRRTMPAWRDILTAEEIDAVVRYQREELGR